MISIRTASTVDIPTIQAIAKVTWPLTFAPLMSKKQLDHLMEVLYSTEALIHQIEEENHHYLLAFNANKAVAYCSYELHYRDKAQLMMHKLYLLPSAQGMGLGRKIIEHLTIIAKKHEQLRLRLQVLNKNEKAMVFYAHLNFKKVGEEPKVLNDELGYFTDNIMVKELSLP